MERQLLAKEVRRNLVLTPEEQIASRLPLQIVVISEAVACNSSSTIRLIDLLTHAIPAQNNHRLEMCLETCLETCLYPMTVDLEGW